MIDKKWTKKFSFYLEVCYELIFIKEVDAQGNIFSFKNVVNGEQYILEIVRELAAN